MIRLNGGPAAGRVLHEDLATPTIRVPYTASSLEIAGETVVETRWARYRHVRSHGNVHDYEFDETEPRLRPA